MFFTIKIWKRILEKKNTDKIGIFQKWFPPYPLQHVFNKLEAGTFSRYLVISIVKFEISSLQ